MLSNDYADRAFQFVEDLDKIETQDDVVDALAANLAVFGFEHFIITGLPSPLEKFEQVVVLRKWPVGWFEHYAAENYVTVDPVIRMCRQSVQPFEWTEAPYDVEREPRAHELMKRAESFGLKRGFSLPIHGLESDACFSMSGADLDLTSRSKPAIHLMAIYAFERARRISERGRSRRKNPLSSREQEVLCWAASGKTAEDTGEILGVTARTVTAHMVSAMDKLDASNKTHAVSRAISLKYITV